MSQQFALFYWLQLSCYYRCKRIPCLQWNHVLWNVILCKFVILEAFAYGIKQLVGFIYLFNSNAYPSKPKIDGVASAKYYEKRKMQSTFLAYRTVTEWKRTV